MSEKSVAQKLLVKEGRKVLLVHAPQGYAARMGELPPGVQVMDAVGEPADIVQVFVEDRKDLEAQLPRLKSVLSPKGALWVTYHKGTSRVKTDINRDTINDYARSIGLEGIAMISIDEDWSALRLKLITP
jgi:hypothetical protein